MRRVVVTGIGLLSTLGNDLNTSWKNLISCKSGIKRISHFDVSDLTSKIAGYIENDPNHSDYFNQLNYLETRDLKRNDRFIQYGLVAAKMAIEDAGLKDLSEEEKLKVGVSVGSGIGGLETIYDGSITINERG